MDFVTLEAEPRTPGKKETKQVRRDGHVPCILYGAATETLSFQVPQMELRPLVFTDQFHRIRLNLDGKTYDCVLKRIDFHPTEDVPTHVDFQRLVEEVEIQLRVPVHFIGDSVGVLEGGTPQEFVHKISIRCLPKNIPDSIDVDITSLEIGQSILVRELNIEGVKINAASDQTLIAITRPREIEVVEVDEELLEGEEGIEGEEGLEGEEAEKGAKGAEGATTEDKG